VNENLHILLLEDSREDAELNEHILRKAGIEFESMRVEERESFITALLEFHPDLVLADYHLPHFNGLEALAIVRERHPHLPVIFVTGTMGEDTAVESLHHGASDYILKDRLGRLPDAVMRALSVAAADWQLFLTEQQLATSEARFRALVETSSDWIWEVDAQGRYTYVSPASMRLLGYAPEEMLGRTPFDFMPPDEAARIRRQFQQYLSEKQPLVQLENTCLHRDGHPVIIETSGVAYYSSTDEFVGYRGIDRDITERKQAELALLRSEQRYHDAVDGLRDAFIVIESTEGRVLQWNPAAEKIFGYSRDEMLGRNLHETLTPARFREAHRQAFPAFGQAGQGAAINRTLELTAVHKDGHEFPIELSLSSIQEDGHWQAVGIVRDISERKKDQERLANQARLAQALLELPRAAEELDEAAFMQRGQELAEELTGSEIAFIHFVNDDQETIELVTWSRRTLEHYCHAAYDKHYPVSQAGIWADALRQRKAVMVNDYASADGKHGLPEGHAHLERLISVPVIENGLVRMMAGVGNKAEHYTDLDVECVQLISNEIWRSVQLQRGRKKLARFSQVIENSVNEVYLFDSQSLLFVEANRGALNNIGYSLKELQQLTPVDLKPEFDKNKFLALLEPLVSRQLNVIRFSTLHRRKDGSTYPVEVTLELTAEQSDAENDKASPTVLVTVLDISERIQAQESLKKSSEQLELALLGSGLGSWDWHVQTGATEFNERWAEMLGYRLSELEPTNIDTWMGLSHPDDLKLAQHELDRHFRGETRLYECEMRMRHRDGSWLWVLDRGKVVERDANGKPLRMAGTHMDISARKAAEENLRKLSQAVEQSPESILITNLEAEIEYANAAFLATSGYTRAQVIGRNPRILQSGKTPQATYDAMWAALTAGQTWKGELINRKASGEDYVEFVHIAPLRQPDGRISHYVAVKEDITEKRRLGEELDRHRHHLEDLVAQRTAELAQARQQAEAASQAKSAFLANMSHEIRTPMNAVLGFAQIGQRDSEDLKARQFFSRIADSGQLLLSLVNDILDYSKMDAGKLGIEERRVDLREVLNRCADQVKQLAQSKNLKFEVQPAPDVPATCLGDSLRLTQVLGNLLSNAIKFTERGSVTLSPVARGGRTGVPGPGYRHRHEQRTSRPTLYPLRAG
jgi:PAS domain S-box-containing protein